MKIGIINCNLGNIGSVEKILNQLKVEVVIINEPTACEKVDKLILPGVGHFSSAMKNLKEKNLIDALNEAVLIRKKPILGICLGMQLMCKNSEEGYTEGLNWFDANVVKFKVSDTKKFKIPHIGWNSVILQKNSNLFNPLDAANNQFYFVHSYYVNPNDKKDMLCTTVYDKSFTSAIEKNNLFGVQFHPEKSHDSGYLLFKNFINL